MEKRKPFEVYVKTIVAGKIREIKDSIVQGIILNTVKKLEDNPVPPEAEKIATNPDTYKIGQEDHHIVYVIIKGRVTVINLDSIPDVLDMILDRFMNRTDMK